MKRMALIFLVLSIFPSIAKAKSCWVDRVYNHENGIEVRFTTGSPTNIYVVNPDNAGTLYLHEQGKYFHHTEDGNAPPEISGIPMDIGDFIRLGNSGHDTCTMEAVIENGHKGLKAAGFFYAHIPDQPPESWEEFFPAE